MASLWNKLTSSTKTNLPSDDAEERQKRTRKQSLSARSRKSLAQIFPNIYGDPANDKENAPAADSELRCEEAGNYPLYDPENPEHNTACQPSARQSRSWSPLKEQMQRGKASLRSKSPSPSRMLTSSRKALNDFANSVKATAAAMRPSTPPALLRDMSSIGRDSEKSLKSKKSVHWRSSESTTLTRASEDRTSPKDILKGSSPTLPNFNYSDHFLGSRIVLTARPPPTPILSALEQADQRPDSIELQRPVFADITQPPLLTPMPGTNLPLEDPFDDAAEIPESEFKIFEDPDRASDRCSASPEPVSDVEVLIGVAQSSIATLAVSECLDQRPVSRSFSRAYVADDDSQMSEDTDTNDNIGRAHPKTIRVLRFSSVDGMGNTDSAPPDLQTTIPKIEVSAPNGSEVGSAVSLGRAPDSDKDSDKENNCQEHPQPSLKVRVGGEHASVLIAKRLPPFQLQANVMSTCPSRDATAFRYGRIRTPSPAGVPLPETPMPGML